MAFGSEAWDFARQRDNDRMEQLAFAGLQTQLAKQRAEKARYESEAANPQTMASFFAQLSGGGQGGVPQDNRFAAGLSDAESRLRALLDNPDSVQQSAAYKFRVNQGQEALQRSLGAKGLLNSGNRLMELTKYGQDMGSQEYDAQAGRLSSLLGNYSQGWNANNAANLSAQASRDTNRLGFAKLAWDMNNPANGGSSRTVTMSGGMNPVQASPLLGLGQERNVDSIFDSDFFNIKTSDYDPETKTQKYWDKKTGKTWTGSASADSNYGRNPNGNWR